MKKEKQYQGEIKGEKWRLVANQDQYSRKYVVSDHGRIKAPEGYVDVIQATGKVIRRRYRKFYLNFDVNPKNMLRRVKLITNEAQNKYATRYIHKLVAQAFVENPFNHAVVLHIDGDKSNNRADNLLWGANPFKGRLKVDIEQAMTYIKLTSKNPHIKAPMIARQMGVSEHEVYRIKRYVHAKAFQKEYEAYFDKLRNNG